jgi:hypothetical protein
LSWWTGARVPRGCGGRQGMQSGISVVSVSNVTKTDVLVILKAEEKK